MRRTRRPPRTTCRQCECSIRRVRTPEGVRVMVRKSLVAVVGIVTLLVGACAAPAPQGRQGAPAPEGGPPAQVSTVPKQLVVGILQEPSGWAPWGANTTAGGTLQVP